MLKLALVVSITGMLLAWWGWPDSAGNPPIPGESTQLGQEADPIAGFRSHSPFEVEVRRPRGAPRVLLTPAEDGRPPLEAACSTCHDAREPDRSNAQGEDLDEFHQGLVFAHGEGSCLRCHDPSNYDRLHLADDTPIDFAEVDRLCTQCHGPQWRDWKRGAHGGMRGSWDLRLGPRWRNGCTDCHDPHAPAFPHMRPTFKPIDRFLENEDHDD